MSIDTTFGQLELRWVYNFRPAQLNVETLGEVTQTLPGLRHSSPGRQPKAFTAFAQLSYRRWAAGHVET
jgi:hypothetical protein